MTEHNERPTRDVLNDALKALQAEPVPEGPPAQLVASTIEALQRTMVSPEVLRLQQRRKLMNDKRYLSILVITVLGTLAMGAPKPALGADIYNSNGFSRPGSACSPTE